MANQMWCFGSTRMFMERAADFEGWHLSQDIVWEKHNGSNAFADRFRRIHELALHFYRGNWRD
ncbi:site-specific DNA-methyltransferase, partial [Acidovorax facilis]|nr:site-specific DNA-methyltransferase [Acidovorax facilis]